MNHVNSNNQVLPVFWFFLKPCVCVEMGRKIYVCCMSPYIEMCIPVCTCAEIREVCQIFSSSTSYLFTKPRATLVITNGHSDTPDSVSHTSSRMLGLQVKG